MDEDKLRLLSKVRNLEKQGYVCPSKLSINDSYDKISYEYQQIIRRVEADHEKQVIKGILRTVDIGLKIIEDKYAVKTAKDY